MDRKTNGRYIQIYTDGSAARRLEPELPSKRLPDRARPKRRSRYVLRIDPLAWCAAAMAVVMVVLMAVGWMQFSAARSQADEMAEYVQQLTRQNETLQQEYREGYDLEDVLQKAQALGMVSAEEAEHMVITVELP